MKDQVIAWSLWRNAGSTYLHDHRHIMLYGAFLVVGEKQGHGGPMRYYRSGQGTPEHARGSALYITENLEKDGFVLRQAPVAAWPLSLTEGPFSVLSQLVLLGSAPDEDWGALWEATLHFGVPLEAGAA